MNPPVAVNDPAVNSPVGPTKATSTSELLDQAVKAHGGLDRWNKVKAIKVVASITGAIWFVKGKGDFLKNVILTAETRDERLTVDFPGQNKRAVFEPHRIVIETLDGTLIEARDNPEKSFEGQQRETPWDDIQVIYFVGEALWTYLNTPFLYTHEGFITEEIPSVQVAGETWRRLKVTFPDNVKSHTREQISRERACARGHRHGRNHASLATQLLSRQQAGSLLHPSHQLPGSRNINPMPASTAQNRSRNSIKLGSLVLRNIFLHGAAHVRREAHYS